MYCERCNVEFPENLRYCKWCGEALIERVRATGDLPSCPHCGEGIKVGWAFCRSCGARLTASVQAIPVCQHCGAVVDPAAGACGQCGRNVAGAIIYKQESGLPHQAEHCPTCGERLDPGVLYCKGCGSPVYSGTAPFGAVAVTCRVCDAYNPAGSTVCRVCGESLVEPVTREYDRPVKPASPTLVDSTDLPDALPFIEDTNKKGAVEMESPSASAEPQQPVLVFLPSTPSEHSTSMETQIMVEVEERISSVPPASATMEFASDTLEMQPETVNARPKGGAQTTILTEPVVSEEEPPLRRDKPTTRIDGSPFEFELESVEAALTPEGYPSRLDEPLKDVIARTEKKPDATIQLGATPKVEEATPPARSGDTIIVGSPEEPVFVIEQQEATVIESQQEPVFVIEQQETTVIESPQEPVFVIEQRQEMPFVFESAERPANVQPQTESGATIDLNQAAFQSQPTIPIRQDDVATMSLSGEATQATRPPETQVKLNEAALQAFGMGAHKEPPPLPPPPTASIPTRAPDFHIPVVLPPAPARSRSLVPMVSTLVVLVVLAGTALALWWYISGGLKTSSKPEISLPPAPENTSAPPPTNTAPTVPAGMALVSAGSYTIGRDLGDDLEKPAHKVDLKAFYIDLTEVTNAAYKQFTDATGHRQPDGWKNGTYPEGRANWPVTGVSWQDAVDYAEWAGKRLPTESEWEAAARGLEGRIYPWGNAWGEGMANIRGASIAEVGQFKLGASPVGALDLIGNVWEWTIDPFKVYPGGTASLEGVLEPGITYKVIRGGAFDRKENIEATYRGFLDANKGYDKTGFRCVKDIK